MDFPIRRRKQLGTDPAKEDTDGDGLKDGEEVMKYKTDPLKVDTDGDGLTDGEEKLLGSDPKEKDTDSDGLNDHFEYKSKIYSPILADTDESGVIDGEKDADADGLTNLQEIEKGTEPFKEDTDEDSLLDGEEVTNGTNPLADDTDNDGLLDSEEDGITFNPQNPDTDGDGILDGDEVVEFETVAGAYLQEKLAYPSVTIESLAKETSTTEIQPISTSHPILNGNIPGLIGNAYSFETGIDFETAEMKFYYDESVVTETFDPAIYY